jgi:hypothetical protein
VKELIKLCSVIPSWPWPKVGQLLALALLYKGKVNFAEALVLMLLAIVIDGIQRRGAPASRPLRTGKVVSRLKKGSLREIRNLEENARSIDSAG